MPLLTEITPDAGFFFNFVGTIGLIATIVAAVRQAAGKNELQKREITFAAEFASKQEVQRMERDVERLEQKMDEALEGIRREMKSDREAINAAGEQRASKIHTRLDMISDRLGEVVGQVTKH
jgi:uncharacterized protein Yka (UPF0111/DUF47 family)